MNNLGPKTPRLALKVLKKIKYEERPSAYLIKWHISSAESDNKKEKEGEVDMENPALTWETEHQLPSVRIF